MAFRWTCLQLGSLSQLDSENNPKPHAGVIGLDSRKEATRGGVSWAHRPFLGKRWNDHLLPHGFLVDWPSYEAFSAAFSFSSLADPRAHSPSRGWASQWSASRTWQGPLLGWGVGGRGSGGGGFPGEATGAPKNGFLFSTRPAACFASAFFFPEAWCGALLALVFCSGQMARTGNNGSFVCLVKGHFVFTHILAPAWKKMPRPGM